MRAATIVRLAVIAALAGCSSTSTDTTATADTTTTTTIAPTTTSTTTTIVEETTTTASATTTGVTVARDVVYLEMNGNEYLVDVYVPDGDGPWPVVIALHGIPASKSNPTNTVVAEAAAEAGMLVFAPNWVAELPQPTAMDAEWMRSQDPAMPCALAFAQQEAAAYGGDPDRTVVYGFSGGATSGAQYVLGPTRDLTTGCKTQTPPMTPVGAVFGDASYFHHITWWDGAFGKDLEAMQTSVAWTVDPAFWAADQPKRIRLWAAEDGTFPRWFDDPWDEDGWLAQRDPDGTIRKDLDELGELDDGIISYIDTGLLLATRLQQSGIDATYDIFPGGHFVDDKLPEIVAYLLDAAGSS